MGMEEGERSYTIAGSGINYTGGRYIIAPTEGPLQAAKRAATKLFGKLKQPEFKAHAKKNTIKFIMRETTGGSDKATRMYRATRKERAKPLERRDKQGNLMYTINWDYDVRACGMDETV